jgi:hypothetical protein
MEEIQLSNSEVAYDRCNYYSADYTSMLTLCWIGVFSGTACLAETPAVNMQVVSQRV